MKSSNYLVSYSFYGNVIFVSRSSVLPIKLVSIWLSASPLSTKLGGYQYICPFHRTVTSLNANVVGAISRLL
jgi:hypothetical protein